MSQQQSNYEVTRLVEEAEKQSIEVVRALYKEVVFGLNNGESRVRVKGRDVGEEDIGAVWFRVAGTRSGKYVEGRNLLIRLLRSQAIFCTNSLGYLNWPRMGKISQHGVFVENDIPVVETKVFYTFDQVREEIEERKDWPLIVKHERGYQGKSVRKFENKAEVEKWLLKVDEKDIGMYLWQKCLPTRWDLRIVVLGGKVLGAMKRSAKGEEFRSNFSLGGEVEKWKISEEEAEIAEKVAAACHLDYCGVDIMKDGAGRNYVLEVNRQCQFQGFEKSTGINVAEAVVEMLRNKF